MQKLIMFKMLLLKQTGEQKMKFLHKKQKFAVLVAFLFSCQTYHADTVAKATEIPSLPSRGSIDVHLNIIEKEGHIYATLTFKNPKCTQRQCLPVVYLDPVKTFLKNTSPLGKFELDSVFTITSEDGIMIPFSLIRKDRPVNPPNLEIPLYQGELVSTEIMLDNAYGFLPGLHTYQIRYQALSAFTVDAGKPNEFKGMVLTSNEVSITINRAPTPAFQ